MLGIALNHLAPLDNLVAALSRLPGIGRRTAERMALALMQDQRGLMRILANALLDVDENMACCKRCGSITLTTANPCGLCTGPRRDAHVICAVESPGDIARIETSGGFQGRYHALMGRLSPIQGIGVADLRIDALLERIVPEGIGEVLLALGTDVESDATASYLYDLLSPRSITVSRIAFGLPTGTAIEYADATTLSHAIQGRQKMR